MIFLQTLKICRVGPSQALYSGNRLKKRSSTFFMPQTYLTNDALPYGCTTDSVFIFESIYYYY